MDDKKLKERGKRLWKNYRWTNEMYDALFALQGGVCAVCGNPPREGGMRLVVDHAHFRVDAWRAASNLIPLEVWWIARALFPNGAWIEQTGKTKKEAIEKVREKALPVSVRGLLCPGRHGKAGHGSCNRLIGRIDNIPWLRKVVHYLENPPAKKLLDNMTHPVIKSL